MRYESNREGHCAISRIAHNRYGNHARTNRRGPAKKSMVRKVNDGENITKGVDE